MLAMLLIVLVTAVCGVLLGVSSKVSVLFPGIAIIVCAGGAHMALYGDAWSLVPTIGSIVSLQVGYAMGAILVDRLLQPNSSKSKSVTRAQ